MIGLLRLNRSVFGGGAKPAFFAPLNDAGSGAVNLTLARGTGGAGTFTRATSATTILSSGLVASVLSGVARSYYSPTGTYLGYLSEAAATNLHLQSENWSVGAPYTTSLITIGNNATASPDGTVTADKLQEDNTSGLHGALQSFTKAASTIQYVFSVWVKAAERTWFYFTLDDGTANNGSRAWFNLGGGVVGTINSSGYTTPFGSTASSIVAFTNGWYRCTFTGLAPVTTTVRAHIDMSTGDTVESYLGVTNSGLYVWGAQFETGAFPTSYIPTTTVAVTRNVDALTYPSLGNFNATQGAVYAEATMPVSAGSGMVVLAGTTGVDEVDIIIVGLTPQFRVQSASVAQAGIALAAMTAGATAKLAGSYALNDFRAANNGTFGTPDVSGNPPTAIGSSIFIGGQGANTLNGAVKNVKIWTVPLTNSQIASL